MTKIQVGAVIWRILTNLGVSTGTLRNVLKQFEETEDMGPQGQKKGH